MRARTIQTILIGMALSCAHAESTSGDVAEWGGQYLGAVAAAQDLMRSECKGVRTPFKGTVESGFRWIATLLEGKDLEEFNSTRASMLPDLDRAAREMNEGFKVWRQKSTSVESACIYVLGLYDGMRNAPERKLLEVEYRKFKRVSLIQRQDK